MGIQPRFRDSCTDQGWFGHSGFVQCRQEVSYQTGVDPLPIAPDQFGKSAKSFETHGHSMIVDPWGQILAELPDGPGVITAEIDLDYLAKVRAELPALKHRRL